MSYDISLCDKEGNMLPAPPHEEGGTYAVGGTGRAELNVTYNYSRHFNFRGLDGRVASETMPEMKAAIKKLGTKRDADYWASTPGNAGRAIKLLLSFAKLHPQGVWQVT